MFLFFLSLFSSFCPKRTNGARYRVHVQRESGLAMHGVCEHERKKAEKAKKERKIRKREGKKRKEEKTMCI